MPTAVQLTAVVQETPSRDPFVSLGVDWIVQLVPSQRSASSVAPKLGAKNSPTAVQAVAALHDTASNWVPVLPAVAAVQDTLAKLLRVAPAGSGTAWIAQLVPFQRSTRACPGP